MRLAASVCALLAFAVVGCGAEDQSARLASASQRPTALVVVSGGNTSCQNGTNSPHGMGMWRPFSGVLGRARDTDVHYIVSCHNSDATVHYISSDAPNVIQSVGFQAFYDRIDAMHEDYRPHRLIVAGHSYGGWLAMKTGLALKADVTTLVTIDAISRVECSFSQPAGCTRAPRDITVAEKQRLNDRSDRWINWFQTRTFYLHSSAMPEADQNRELRVSHTEIDVQQEVWSDLQEAILGAVGV